MKKAFAIIFSIGFMSGVAMADETQGMLIQKSDGTQVQVAIGAIRSIRFEEGKMQICQTDNALQQIAVEDIAKITFGSISTAIRSIVGDASQQHIMVTDLSGKVIYEGEAAAYRETVTEPGTYVISTQGQSHKITIK